MVLYASDLDRTLIFSARFLSEYPCDKSYTPVEYKDDKIISYMADEVISKLNYVSSKENVQFVPVTLRGIEEYNRVNLGVKPDYAIVAGGGVILDKYGNSLEEWDKYVSSGFDKFEMLEIIGDIEDSLDSVDYQVKVIDNCYLFFKTKDVELFDTEVEYLDEKYENWLFIRQGNKCYAIPKHISKQSALKWLWNKLNKPYIIASGDSEMDLPMLTLANQAVIPEHGSLIKSGIIIDGRIISGGILSALETMRMVDEAS